MAFNGTGSNVTSLNASNVASGTLAVARGGTGQTTLTSGALLTGNGTSAIGSIAVGSSGQAIISNGSAWVAGTPSGGQQNYAIFASSGTWTCPAGVSKVLAYVISGGGGSSYNPDDGDYGYGGSGGCAVGVYTVSAGTGYSITVGSGGTTSKGSGDRIAGSGSTSSFSSFCSATGGGGGRTANSIPSPAVGAGTGGNIINSVAPSPLTKNDTTSYQITQPFFGGAPIRVPSGGSDLSPVAWSVTSAWCPGAAGNPYSAFVAGGVGGAVLLLYIG